jgi:hypothetical protein
MATQTEPKQTKTAFVRGVLQEIGAITPNPPEGWRQRVEEALKKHNLDMHQVTIYQIRQKALKDKQGGKGKAKGKTGKAVAVPVNNGVVAALHGAGPVANLTLGDLQAIQTFAEKFGGVAGLQAACNALQTLKG